MSVNHTLMRILTLSAALLPVALAATPPTGPRGVNSTFAFEANRGQTAPEVRYLARTPNGIVFFTAGEMVLRRGDNALRFEFMGANLKAAWQPAEPSGETLSYYIGRDRTKWVEGLHRYGRLVRRGLYPGIDLVLYGNAGRLEYDFVLAPRVDPSRIRLRVTGGRALFIDGDGALVVDTPAGPVRQRKPALYQTSADGSRKPVEGAFRLLGANQVGFSVAGRDPELGLSIDPVLESSTYVGGSLDDRIIATNGSDLMVGMTASIDFPGSGLARCRGNDIFVRGYGNYGSQIMIIGGSGDDQVTSALLGGYSSYTIVAGYTDSHDLPTNLTLPRQSSQFVPWQADYAGGATDGFLLVLNPTSVMVTYVGTPGDDRVAGLATSAPYSSTIAVTGTTNGRGLPAGNQYYQPFQAEPAGGLDGFLLIASVGSSSSSVSGVTYFGGSGDDFPLSVAATATSSAYEYYVSGYTRSPDFPLLNALSSQRNGDSDAFLMRIAVQSARFSLTASTLFGGGGDDRGVQAGLLPNGNVVVAGVTSSTDLPTQDPLQASYGGGSSDSFLAQYTPALDRLISATYLGGSGADEVTSLAVSYTGDLFVAGWTSSPDLPVRNALQSTYGGGDTDGFLVQFDSSGSLHQTTYFGGSGRDAVLGLYAPGGSYIWLAGQTNSPDLPLKDQQQDALQGASDGFIARLSTNLLSTRNQVIGGKDLRGSTVVYLGDSAAAKTVAVTVTSSDAQTVQVAAGANDPGQASATLPVLPNYSGESRTLYVDCLSDSGGADLGFSAPGYVSVTSHVFCSPARLTYSYSTLSTNPWADPSAISFVLYATDPERQVTSASLMPKPGLDPPVVLIENTNPTVGTVSASTVPLTSSYGTQVRFQPLSAGETELIFTSPTLIVAPPGRLKFTVSSPLTSTRSLIVPAGFSTQFSVGSNSGRGLPVSITVTSSDPSRVVVSRDVAQPGTASLTVGTAYYSVPIFVQALASSGEVSLAISAPGVDPATVVVKLASPVVRVYPASLALRVGASGSASVGISADSPDVYYGNYFPNPGTPPLRVSLESSDPSVASCSPDSVTLSQSSFVAYFTVRGLSAGAATLTVHPPEGLPLHPSAVAGVAVSVKGGALRFDDLDLGKGLVGVMALKFPGTLNAATDVTLTIDNPELALLSLTQSGTGAPGITVKAAAGSDTVSFYVIGFASAGQAKVTALAAGYQAVTANVTLRPSGFGWTSNTYSSVLYAQSSPSVGVTGFALDPATMMPLVAQRLRQGVTATIRIANSAPDVVTVSKDTLNLPSDGYSAIITGRASGQAVLTFTQPAGFSQPAILQRAVVKVTTPSFSLSSLVLAKNTQAPLEITGLASIQQPLTLTSADPVRLLISTDPAVVGTASVTIPDLRQRRTIYVQALDGQGPVVISASVPTYRDASASVTLVPAGITLSASSSPPTGSVSNGNSFSTTTQSPITSIVVYICKYGGEGCSGVGYATTVRPGAGPVRVEVVSSNPGAGTILGSPAVIPEGANSAQVQFKPVGEGETQVSAVQPPGFVPPPSGASLAFSVSAPAIRGSNIALGKDTYASARVSLPDNVSSPETNVTVVLTSTDPSRVLLSRDADSAPAASITETLVAGQRAAGQFWIHALGNDGIVPIHIRAPGYAETEFNVAPRDTMFLFAAGDTNLRAVVQGGPQKTQILAALPQGSAPSGYPSYSQLTLRPGAAEIPIAVQSSDPDVLSIDGPQPVFRPGSTSAEFTYRPVRAGQATVSMEVPAGYLVDPNHRQLSFSVEGGRLSFYQTSVKLGRDLQTFLFAMTESAVKQETSATITSSDPSRLLVAGGATSPGQQSITLTVRPGNFNTFYAHSLADQGEATLTLAADGFQSATLPVTLVPSAAVFSYGTDTVTLFSNGTVWKGSVRLVSLDPATLKSLGESKMRPGATLSVEVTSSDPQVATVKPASIDFTPDQDATVDVQPLALGTAIVSLGLLPGGPSPASNRQVVVNVVEPDLSLPGFTLGRDLLVPVRIKLADRLPVQSSDVSVNVYSSDTSLITLSNDPAVAGTNWAAPVIPAGQRLSKPFYVQAMAKTGAATLRTSSRYAESQASVTVSQTAFVFQEASQGQPVSATVGVPLTLNIVPAVMPLGAPSLDGLALRPGAAPVSITVGSSSDQVLSIPNPRLVFKPGDQKAPVTVQPVAAGRVMLGLSGSVYDFATAQSTLSVTVAAK